MLEKIKKEKGYIDGELIGAVFGLIVFLLIIIFLFFIRQSVTHSYLIFCIL